ncbi:unnamed protein product (macronuclear) [Paramecium tetraurelia]|uniref:Uncharacterized protein n=1 Tax=Paramecium tetraurelia TaxID=5888 RepID=A0CV99_PARTE|nr:uncharacterized protein GSPATT00010884001 [Paramecium tetraurelia]CAK74716.1 unnamed protein product [Paramecium tetraurelia]|eukprot:XP_001442113.1 hypothetical protein (macronuclear) [Paramecium tetraurelia strain d4-2]
MGVCSSKQSDKELQKAQYLQRLKEFKAKFKQSTAEIIIPFNEAQHDDNQNKAKYVISQNPIVKRRSKQFHEITILPLKTNDNKN